MTDLNELLRSAEPPSEPGFDASDVARRVHERRRRRSTAAVATTLAAVSAGAVFAAGPVGLWRRSPSNVVLSQPTAATAEKPATSGGMWPQTSPAEVTEAQDRADAGDPAYTWQLDASLAANEDPWGAKIFARFIQDELGWEEFAGASFAGYMYGEGGGDYEGVLFIRCDPGRPNPLRRLFTDAPTEISACAPTIDDHTYETVRVSAAQPGLRGPAGIWVVDRWEILQSEYEPTGLYDVLSRDYLVEDPGRITQATPPSEDEVTAVLEAFLRARLAGQGAERLLLTDPEESSEVPLLYAASSGAPYERFSFERLQGPVWPTGWTEHKVRLVAADGSVVEQKLTVARQHRALRLLYDNLSGDAVTTENGKPVAVRFSEFGDTVSFTAAPPRIPNGDGSVDLASAVSSNGRVVLAIDPRPDRPTPACENVGGAEQPAIGAPVPTLDASALGRSIQADPGFETTASAPVTIAGEEGMQIEATFTADATPCYDQWEPGDAPAGNTARWRMRLYLISYPTPGGPSESGFAPHVLTVAVIASESDFDRVLREATPVLDSLQFHAAR